MRALPPLTKPVLRHLLAWLVFIMYESLLVIILDLSRFHPLEVLLSFALNAAFFYINALLLLPRFIAHGRYVAYLLGLLLALGCFAGLRYGLHTFVFEQPIHAYKTFWVQTIYRGVYFLFPSLGYWFAQHAIQMEKQKRQQTQELRLAEKNLLQANLDFLRNQINPHFLFNSLNFLYAQVYPHSENAARGILLLADTMRYALHEDHGGKVMLAQEVQHLHNYIALNQLRFNNTLQVEFEERGYLQFAMILPLVLITFVENCFKHGELTDPANPLRIQLVVESRQLFFQTHNRKRNGPKEKGTSIGLANTRKRLDAVYKENYSLDLYDAPDTYTCTLIIEL